MSFFKFNFVAYCQEFQEHCPAKVAVYVPDNFFVCVLLIIKIFFST
jgi:hypothetical protein